VNRLTGIFKKNNFIVPLVIVLMLFCKTVQAQNAYTDAENHYQAGLKLFQENKLDQALDEFSYSISKNPNHVNARFNKAMIHIRKLQYNQAILDLEELRRISPVFDKVNYYLGLSKYKVEASDSALSDLKREMRIHPQYFESYYLAGRIYLLNQKADSAIYFLNKSLLYNQKYYSTYHDLGVAYFIKNSLDTAAGFFTEAIKLKPSSVMSYRDLAMVYYYKGKPDLAIQKLYIAYGLDSTNIYTLMNLGTLLYETQNYIEAKNMFSQSIEINPDYLPAYINRSAIYIEMGKYEEAIADLDLYILNDDKNGQAYLNRGIANENTFRWKEACRDWKRAMELGVTKAQKYVEEQCKE
jgi:tetratricopeptide (TPR) repeat protein